MSLFVDHVGGLASLIGSLTVVGSALIWVYNRFIGKPREERRLKRDEELQEKMIHLITEKQIPMISSIDQLNKLLEQSQADRKKLNTLAKTNTGIIKEHEETLEEHDKRLIILETKNGLSEYRYKKGGE